MAALHARTHPTPVDGCFGCKAMGVAIGFHSCPGGRDEWHGPTIVQRQQHELQMAASRGQTLEPVHTKADSWAPVNATA